MDVNIPASGLAECGGPLLGAEDRPEWRACSPGSLADADARLSQRPTRTRRAESRPPRGRVAAGAEPGEESDGVCCMRPVQMGSCTCRHYARFRHGESRRSTFRRIGPPAICVGPSIRFRCGTSRRQGRSRVPLWPSGGAGQASGD